LREVTYFTGKHFTTLNVHRWYYLFRLIKYVEGRARVEKFNNTVVVNQMFVVCITGKKMTSYLFDVLLTVHLSIILVINQLDAQNLVL